MYVAYEEQCGNCTNFDFQGDSTKDKKSNLAKIKSIFRSSQTGASAPLH